MKRMLRTAAALLLGASLLVTGASAAATQFDDVPANHWAYSYVTRAAQEGLVSGMGDGVYGESEPLNLGEFATMICQLLYPEADDAYAGRSSYWWYQYVEAAYQKGDLNGTVAGNRRASDGAWTATVVEADMNRYDLAQIIFNVMNSQDWETPDTALVALALATIPDREDIPDSYQAAVAMAYAGGFLTGMDDKGTFGGEGSMTRAQAAVVLCALLDAKQEMDAPTYTNRAGKLVNGSDANEDNVRQAISGLRQEFYEFYIYDTERTYTSQRLGTASGGQGFAYMFSDRVFGALPAQEQDDPDQLKPGDLVSLDGEYQVVTDVSGNSYNYVSCDSLGIVYWRTDGRIDDIGSRDTIWTRYEGVVDRDLDVADVEDALADLEDEYYGERWTDDDYDSDVLGASYGYSEAFAYWISDELFGDLEDTKLDPDDGDVRLRDIRVGDMVRLWDEDDNGEIVYGIVLTVDTDKSRNEIQILFAEYDDHEDEYYIATGWVDFDDLYLVYTRYSDDQSSSVAPDDFTETDIKDALDEIEDDYLGTRWRKSSYNSDVLGRSSGYSEAFAYQISDELFGDQDETRLDPDSSSVWLDDIRVGDIVQLTGKDSNDETVYGIVLTVNEDDSRDQIQILFAEYDHKDYKDEYSIQRDWVDFDDLYWIYTRYSNHTEADIKDALDEIEDDYLGTRWRKSSYNSDVLGRSSGYSEAFAYQISDELFGDQDETRLDPDSSSVWLDDIRVGDIVQLTGKDSNDETVYGIVLTVNEDDSRDQIQILFAEYDHKDYKDEYSIQRDWVDFDDLYWIYTRY